MGAPRLVDDHGYEEGTVITTDESGWTWPTSVRRKMRTADDDDEPSALPEEPPPGWAEPD